MRDRYPGKPNGKVSAMSLDRCARLRKRLIEIGRALALTHNRTGYIDGRVRTNDTEKDR